MSPDVAAFLDEINELLDNGRLGWAWSTLVGIRDAVKARNEVTVGQRTAVDNIAIGRRDGLPSDKYRSSRRYEGYAPTEGGR